MKKIINAFKKAFKSRGFKYGGFSAVIIAVVLAIVTGVNLIVSALPTTYTKFDVSGSKLYTLSADTKELVKGVNQEVTLYLVAQSGNEDDTVYETLKRYAALNAGIKVQKKDPAVFPNFVSQYTESTLSENSVIVVCGKRARAIDYSELYQADYSNAYTTGQVSYSNNMEAELTSAIDYVTAGELAKVCVLSGHGEAALSDEFSGYIEKENIELEELSLISSGKVPEDADMLMVIAPASDISADEAEILNAYLEQGGKLMLFTNYTGESLPNLEKVMAGYGVEAVNGIVMETDAQHYYQQYYGLLPEQEYHEITSSLLSDSLYNLLSGAHGLKTSENVRSTLEITPLLSTTDMSYAKMDALNMTTIEREDGDEDGPFSLAVAVEEQYGESDTRIVWFASSSVLDADYDSLVSGGNSDLVLNSIGWLIGETGSNLSIHAKQLSATALSVSGASVVLWFAVLIIIVPVLLIAAGLVVWLRRRKL